MARRYRIRRYTLSRIQETSSCLHCSSGSPESGTLYSRLSRICCKHLSCLSFHHILLEEITMLLTYNWDIFYLFLFQNMFQDIHCMYLWILNILKVNTTFMYKKSFNLYLSFPEAKSYFISLCMQQKRT